jgi:antitoxin ParD1/3/4
MNVSLTPELERLIEQKVSSGLYGSASEVVREALRLLHYHEQAQARMVGELNRLIDEGIAEADRGELLSPAQARRRTSATLRKAARRRR